MGAMSKSPVLEVRPLGFPWQPSDPFLFCVHHDDAYPKGNAVMGPETKLLEGRNLGMDFETKDGFRMYHGHVVPGFPQHPHRGFETITIVRRGFIDHSDSLGAAARFGRGDVQWLTAGSGINHSEMFPLLSDSEANPLELFQIWLNLPAEDKMVAPHFSMLWNDAIPRIAAKDADGRAAEITVYAGTLDGKKGAPPPPRSWAARADSHVEVMTIRLDARAKWTLPRAAHGDVKRTLFFFRGPSMRVADHDLRVHCSVRIAGDGEIELEAGDAECEVLLLGGRPIAEPIVQHGPFVMASRAEIERAIADYRRTRFGGWPWPAEDPVHPRAEGRFAKHADGRIERP
jgi:redox-sensitive bicupin YhaK (pirin superfamily)